jgi:hypothetical protein
MGESPEALLDKLAAASAQLVGMADPMMSPDDPDLQDVWNHAIPADWRLQLRFLWVDAADAFALIANTLPVRVAPTLLAQIRFLVEGYSLVMWLASPEEGRDLRGFAFAGSEAKDIRNFLLKWKDHDDERRATLDEMEQIGSDVQVMSKAEALPKMPSMPMLVAKHYSPVAYALLSDVGSHAGLASVVVYFLDRGTQIIDLNMQSGVGGEGLLPRYGLRVVRPPRCRDMSSARVGRNGRRDSGSR